MNNCSFVGRLTADPKTSTTGTGIAVANFAIAVDRNISADAKTRGEVSVDFINIVAWRQDAEFVGNYLSKGRMVAVTGRLQIREYTTGTGERARITEIVADSVRGLDKAPEGTEPRTPRAPATPVARRPEVYKGDDFIDTEDPFAE